MQANESIAICTLMCELNLLKEMNDSLRESKNVLVHEVRRLKTIESMVPKLRLANEELKRRCNVFRCLGARERAAWVCAKYINSREMKKFTCCRQAQVNVIDAIFGDSNVTRVFDNATESRIGIHNIRSIVYIGMTSREGAIAIVVLAGACDLKGYRNDCFMSFIDLMEAVGVFRR